MYEYKIKELVKVVDGDTIEVVIDLGFSIYINYTIRLLGINAAETRTKNLIEKSQGLLAKTWLTKELVGKSLTIKTIKNDKKDKFGRLLAEVFVEGNEISVNQKMLNENIVNTY
jgi:micrococcal nuclease